MRQTIETMEGLPPPIEGAEAEAGEDLYGRWLEWVTINLGRDSHLASAAARAATEAALKGDGFAGAVEAARNAWFSGKPSDTPRSIDWVGAIGQVVKIGSLLMLLALVAAVGIGFLAFRNFSPISSAPIILCPDMCGGLPEGQTPSLFAHLTRWSPGGEELAGTITSSAGPTCKLPIFEIKFLDSDGAEIGAVEIVLPTAVVSGQTLNWDFKFWPPPGLDEPLDYTLDDGTRITEIDGMTGPVPATAVRAGVANTTCLEY